MTGRGKGDNTRLVGAGRRPEWTHDTTTRRGVVNPPVWRGSTILYDSVADLRAGMAERDTHHWHYGRRGMPTQWSLAEALDELEPGAEGTFLFPSGTSAVTTALLSVLSPGDELLLVDSAYEPTQSFARGYLQRFGVTTRFYDPYVGAGIADLIGENTRAILLESPGSSTFEVQDVPAIVAVAKARGIVTLLDNTWATPLLFPAIAHGIDLSILACTKYIVGHADVMLGSVTAAPGHFAQLRATARELGLVASPDDCALASRGLRTLGVRLRQHEASAFRIAQWLDERSEVARVLHPALPDDSGHFLWQRDFRGASGLFAFALQDGTEQSRAAFIDALTLFGIGYSWGGFESLALPADPDRQVAQRDFGGPLVRLSIGLEDVDDLIADLDQAFAAFRSARA